MRFYALLCDYGTETASLIAAFVKDTGWQAKSPNFLRAGEDKLRGNDLVLTSYECVNN